MGMEYGYPLKILVETLKNIVEMIRKTDPHAEYFENVR